MSPGLARYSLRTVSSLLLHVHCSRCSSPPPLAFLLSNSVTVPWRMCQCGDNFVENLHLPTSLWVPGSVSNHRQGSTFYLLSNLPGPFSLLSFVFWTGWTGDRQSRGLVLFIYLFGGLRALWACHGVHVCVQGTTCRSLLPLPLPCGL